jgi:hypothetical protein
LARSGPHRHTNEVLWDCDRGDERLEELQLSPPRQIPSLTADSAMNENVRAATRCMLIMAVLSILIVVTIMSRAAFEKGRGFFDLRG